MIVKLKSIDQLVEEFGFEEHRGSYRRRDENQLSHQEWLINGEMLSYFGDEVYVEEIEDEWPSNYTHRFLTDKKEVWFLHKDWFEKPEDFIKEDEFML